MSQEMKSTRSNSQTGLILLLLGIALLFGQIGTKKYESTIIARERRPGALGKDRQRHKRERQNPDKSPPLDRSGHGSKLFRGAFGVNRAERPT